MDVKSPSPEYDFMLKGEQSKKRSLPMPNLPKPFLLIGGALLFIILLIVVSSAWSGRNNKKFATYDGVLARGNETLRVTKLAQQLNLQDPQTQALAATISSAFASDQTQYMKYLSNNHIKVSGAQLTIDTDKTTDTTLQSASQNNNLDEAYVNYIKFALGKYANDLVLAQNGAGPKGKNLLNSSVESTRTLLNSSPVKS